LRSLRGDSAVIAAKRNHLPTHTIVALDRNDRDFGLEGTAILAGSQSTAGGVLCGHDGLSHAIGAAAGDGQSGDPLLPVS
jgi:hypothetical protein